MTERASRFMRRQQKGDTRQASVRGWLRQCATPLLICALLVAGAPAFTVAGAQQAAPAQRATRAELTARAAAIEAQLASGGKDKAKLQAEAATLKTRLTEGDFSPGDRFLITIVQDAATRSDTATVRDSLLVSLVGLPDISLKGTLRSELNERLGAHVARFLRNSSVRTVVFTRIAILGGVFRPGYYAVPPDQPMGDILMLAGGTTVEGRLNDLQVNRGSATLLSVKESRKALKEGRTLEQLDVRSGDEIKVPVKRKISPQTVFQVMFFVSSIFFAIVNFLRFYYQQQQP